MPDLQVLADEVRCLCRDLCCSTRQELELTLILEELCANIIAHGGRNGATTIDVGLEKIRDTLEITIRDDGPPFDPTCSPRVDTAKPLAERKPGGLGVHLVHHFANAIEYRRENRYNVLIIKKNL